MPLPRRQLLTALGFAALAPEAFAQRQRTAPPTGQLILRYALGVPEAQQTRFDKAVARALDRVPGLKADLRKRIKGTPPPPAFDADAFGKLKTPRRSRDNDLLDPKVFKRLELPKTPTKIRLHVEGLHCFTDTSGIGSDETYGVYAIVMPKSGPAGDRWGVTMGQFPLADPYVSMGSGDTVKGPRRLIYDDAIRDMVVVSILLENDNWGPSVARTLFEGMVRSRLATLQEVDANASFDDVADNLTDECNQLNNGDNFYNYDGPHNDDDIIQAKVRAFKKSDLLQMVQREPYDTEATPDGKELPARMPYHFRTRHKGDGAHYLCYYKVEPS